MDDNFLEGKSSQSNYPYDDIILNIITAIYLLLKI